MTENKSDTKTLTQEEALKVLTEKSAMLQEYLKKVDQQGMYKQGEAASTWFMQMLNWLYIILEPFNFLFRAFLGLALLCYGGEFHLLVICLQTFRVTALPVIYDNQEFLKESQDKVAIVMKEQAAKLKDIYPDGDSLQKDMEEMKTMNTALKSADPKDVEEMTKKMEKYNRLMAGATIGTKAFTKIMARVDPAKLQGITIAFVSGCMACLVTLKNEVLSLITQAVDIANQIAGQVKEQTKPMILKQMKDNAKVMEEQIDEEDRKHFQNEKGHLNDKSLNWINFGIDIFFTGLIISVCQQINWILQVFASIQLGSTILGDELNRLLRQQGKPELDGKMLNNVKQFQIAVGSIIQVWYMAEIPYLIKLLFFPIFWIESFLKMQVASGAA